MADTMQFDLVSPERRLASAPVTEVRIPGAEGDFTAMPGHAPFLSTLRPGIVVAKSAEGEMRYVVTGGFAEVGATGVSVLAERSVPATELKPPEYDQMVAEARKAAEAATPEARDGAQKLVADLIGIAIDVGLNPPQM